MRTLAEFTRTTLIGGLLIILPIYVALLLLAKTVKGLLGLLQPVAERVPASVEFRQMVAIVLLVGVCFVVGLIVRTGPGLRAKNACERAVLERLPGYTFLRGLAKRLAGKSEEQTLQPALVELEDALVPALIVEELDDGSYTVLVPSAPTPMAGSVYILPRDGCTRSTSPSPRPSACSRNGAPGPVSSFARCAIGQLCKRIRRRRRLEPETRSTRSRHAALHRRHRSGLPTWPGSITSWIGRHR